MAPHGQKPTLGEKILQHVIVFAVCIVFPGATTAFVPASWVTFERIGTEVHCTARTCVYFIVPFKTQRIENVTSISQHERAGRTERVRKHGRTTDKTVEVQGEGYLEIHETEENFIEVSVSPASLEGVVEKAESFLNSPNETSRTLFVIANWKFGLLMGGTLTLFTLLYVVGYSLQLLKVLYKGLRRIAGGK